ncbi:chemotaxis protein [Escherichia coli]|nr:chemotaxis protein [Escherichia coli]
MLFSWQCYAPRKQFADPVDRPVVTNGAIVIHTQRLKSDPGGNLLS